MGYYTLSLGAPFGAPFYGGSGISELVPGVFPVALNGRPYLLNLEPFADGASAFRRQSLPLLRQQADQSVTPGEASVSPESFWRRAQDSWHKGAGQSYFDRNDSDPFRFNTSKGIDPWTKWELSLLNDVTEIRSDSATNQFLAVAGNYLYIADTNDVLYTTNGTTFSTVTAFGSGAVVGLASDGRYIWVAKAAAIFQIDTTSAPGTATQIAQVATSQTFNFIGWNKNRLFAAQTNGGMFNVNDTTDKVMGHSATVNPYVVNLTTRGFTWTSSAGGSGYHYLGGYQGDKSLIYKTALTTDATALTAGVVAGSLPDGEKLEAMAEYLGYLILGTNLGVRFSAVDDAGNLTIGGLIETPNPVKCFEPQDRFVWFGYTNYDGVSTGLGRLDVSEFTSPLTPAYASDLMVTGQGTVQSVVTWQNTRVFSVNGDGVFKENTASHVTSGVLTTGKVTYEIIDPKVAVFMDALHEPVAGTIQLEISPDSEAYINAGIHSTLNVTSPPSQFLNGIKGSEFEIRITLTESGSTSPVLNRWTLRSYPAPIRLSKWRVPVLIYDALSVNGQDYPFDAQDEYQALIDLHNDQNVFVYQEGDVSYSVVMDDYTWLPEKKSAVGGYQGTFVADLRQVAGG